MLGEATVQFLALGLGYGKRLRVLSDAIPRGLNKLDTLLDTEAQNFFKLGWTHVPKFTPALARMQSVRITPRITCGPDRRAPCRSCKARDGTDRQVHALVRRPIPPCICLLRRTKPSTLQLPAPCEAKNMNMKQSSTAGSPWFWMGQAPPG